ncbi:MAG: nitroreductase family protein [Clostridiales bacterium]|nr:nitroreductase family protein [Clostridiales bacterium]
MDFLTLVKERYSVRSFKADAIPDEIAEKIIEAGRVAPTACNKQPQRIIVLNNEKGLDRLKKCTECHFNAPLAFVICYDKSECWKRSYDGKQSGTVDASIVTTHMMLEAASLGIGSTWVMYFIPEAVKTEFELDDNTEPVAILTMGYPSDTAKPSGMHFSRKNKEQTVFYWNK